MRKKLTDLAIKGLKPLGGKQTDYFDTSLPGLFARVSKNGVRSFGCLYRFNGQLRRETFKERYPAISLAEARRRAGEIFAAAGEGRDPRLEKQERAAEQLRANSDLYAEAVEDFIERYAIAKKHNRSAKEQKAPPAQGQ